MIKSILFKICRPVKTFLKTYHRKNNRQKMMKAYLKIKAGKFCATYNKEVTA